MVSQLSSGESMKTTHPSLCRVCTNTCGISVEVEDGRITAIKGDGNNPVYNGYLCIKGSGHQALYDHPERLVRSLKRMPDGRHVEIPTMEAIDEIAERMAGIVDAHGPRALATYFGVTYAFDNPVNLAIVGAFHKAIGSPMSFQSGSSDSPGKPIAKGLHGVWMAPAAVRDPEAVLLIGQNPWVSHAHRNGHPRELFGELTRPGTSLIVVDPRRTETARRATIHLQPRPGNDVAIMAAMLRQIFADGLQDSEFLADNVTGVEALQAAVAPFTPDVVARRADIDAVQLVEAARLFGSTRRGYGACGVGANMSGEGVLNEYMLLCLDTVSGHLMRAGEQVHNAMTLLPQFLQTAKAQAIPPFPVVGVGEQSRVRGLGQTAYGMPGSTLADEIMLPGDGQVRGLISLGGNPLKSIPDEARIREALNSLELFVQADVQMSPTAKIAEFVLAAKLSYEEPGTTMIPDFMALYANGSGYRDSFAQYTPAIVEVPDGSDLIAAWEVLYELAARRGLQLVVSSGAGDMTPGGAAVELDMKHRPSTDDLLEIVHVGSRIPLAEVKRHPHGAYFPDPPLFVEPKDGDWEGRLQVGDPSMMVDLNAVAERTEDASSRGFPLRLTCRRLTYVSNSPSIAMPIARPKFNSAYLHPDELADLGLVSGQEVRISSARGRIAAIVEEDATLRRGVVSMSHSWGDVDEDADVRQVGSHPGRLVDSTGIFDRYSGQPRMTNIPVRITVPEPAE
jgi:anaerobic selenocysteine-containing dehydrogenase